MAEEPCSSFAKSLHSYSNQRHRLSNCISRYKVVESLLYSITFNSISIIKYPITSFCSITSLPFDHFAIRKIKV